jgi:NADPH-dependent 2,4-dienoyl-CoA reductase/sulfur reductase-like enzyme
MRLVVVGGSDAGIAAALRAHELDPSVEATVVVADAFPNFSICGLPYYLSGDVADWRDLAHRTTTDLEAAGPRLLLDHTARAIDPAAKQVTITTPDGGERQLGYDQLVIGTGAVPVRPRSTAWTSQGCTSCTPWTTPSPSTRPSPPAPGRP